MAKFRKSKKSGDLGNRLDSIKELFTSLEKDRETLRESGEIAPSGCWIVRYQARGTGGTYWYYKWQSHDPIFVTKEGKMSCHKYIGKAGSPAFMKAVDMVMRRTKIEGLQQSLYTVELALSDLVEEATRERES
jgi:hypothetical protein